MKKIILPIILSTIVLASCDITLDNTNTSTKPNTNNTESGTNNSETSTNALEFKESYTHDVVKSGIYSGSYYDSITSTDKDTLITQLNTLINNGYVKYSYSSQTSNLKVTDSYDGNYVECLYSGERIDKDNSNGSAGQWNKEHIWAKTYGFKNESYQSYSDIQMLRVTEGSINGKRGDKYFDNVSQGESAEGCSWSNDAFEPRDEVKGDVARIMFYMTVMYNDSNLNLELTDDVSKINSSASQLGGTAYLGKLSTLLKWAAEDPVDEREISRNNAIYSIQKNRNPFIDHPEYAYYIFKDECSALNLSYDDFYDNNEYVASNTEALSYMDKLVDSIGEVTLAKEGLINSINEKYTLLDSDTQSFFKGYQKLQEATYQLQVLKDLENRDTTISTSIDLTISSSASGETTKNGINVKFDSLQSIKGTGLYAQTTKPITLNITNLYNTIKTCEITYKCNKDNPTGQIIITDGITSEYLDIQTTKSTQVAVIDLSKFDFSKEITITITRTATTGSIIVPNISFKI